MAPNEPIEDQNHETEEETISNKSIEQDKDDAKEENATASSAEAKEEEDEDLEEGELKDDDEDDDDDEEEETKRLTSSYNNDNNSGFAKESSFNDNKHDIQQQQHHHHPHHQNYPPHHSASGQQPPQMYLHHQSRRISPNSQHQNEMQNQYPSNHFSSNINNNNNNNNNNHYRYPPNDGPPPPMSQHPQSGGPVSMYPRGGPGNAGPMHKVNIRCRFYSKSSNKCTWGDHCRFEHRDDSPGPEFDNRPPPNLGPGSSRGPPPPMGAADRGSPYPPYAGRHQPYQPLPPPHGYPYDAYGQHHSTPPPLPPPPHSMSHWRQQHSPYPSPSSTHPPESVSPALLPTPGNGDPVNTSGRGPPPPPGSSGGSGSSGGGGGGGGSSGVQLPAGGVSSPGYPSPSSSAVVYERKHRLAYELAPWNDRGYPPPSKYDRGDPAGYPGGRGFYQRSHYNREPPYGREPPPPHMGGQYPGYPTYPSSYRGGSMRPHASHYKYMSSSQRTVPPDTRRSRLNKRGHDEDESSWSESGSEDSILGQANYSNKNHTTKASKQLPSENTVSDEPLEQGSGTPPGEPLPEDRERQEMLLNKLKEIEDLMAKKKGEQEDPM